MPLHPEWGSKTNTGYKRKISYESDSMLKNLSKRRRENAYDFMFGERWYMELLSMFSGDPDIKRTIVKFLQPLTLFESISEDTNDCLLFEIFSGTQTLYTTYEEIPPDQKQEFNCLMQTPWADSFTYQYVVSVTMNSDGEEEQDPIPDLPKDFFSEEVIWDSKGWKRHAIKVSGQWGAVHDIIMWSALCKSPIYDHLFIMCVENGKVRFFEENTSDPCGGKYELWDDNGETEQITQQTCLDFLRLVRHYECEYIFDCPIPT